MANEITASRPALGTLDHYLTTSQIIPYEAVSDIEKYEEYLTACTEVLHWPAVESRERRKSAIMSACALVLGISTTVMPTWPGMDATALYIAGTQFFSWLPYLTRPTVTLEGVNQHYGPLLIDGN
ncbi:hypothetical protein HY639_01340 [Candidatus Woesearchaeota archaeon]|nr:hypothetical protein [Candidatus Woesearchaeota archaeon]